MSDLQKVIHSLCEVIIGYNETQTGKVYSLEELLKQSDSDFLKSLEAILKDATKNWPIRTGLLNYILFEIKELKPLVEQTHLLTTEEEKKVKENLTDLLVNIKKLLETSKSENVEVKYAGKREEMPGLKLWGLCNSGQLLKKKLLEPLKLDSDKIVEHDITNLVIALISDHLKEIKQPIIEKQNEVLTETLETVLKANTSLTEENLILKKAVAQLTSEKEDLSNKFASSEERCKALQLQLDKLMEENKSLKEKQEQSLEKHLSPEKTAPGSGENLKQEKPKEHGIYTNPLYPRSTMYTMFNTTFSQLPLAQGRPESVLAYLISKNRNENLPSPDLQKTEKPPFQ
ncbi:MULTISPECIES: hypothetical protein [unclassified Legionella]|uniref:hypothetical protein n=1 Tax=unclassified Legionella TaxID=2622702 RepID=UPI001054F4C4|nr:MULTISPECIES: hypothetical protein [unclassified Legionella]MDI9817709.1 hypothetical protein [Legionella sp. PL877]